MQISFTPHLRLHIKHQLTQHHEALVNVVRLLQRLALAVRLLCHLTARQIDEIDLALLRDEDAILRLLLRCDVHTENGVAA